MKIISKRFLGLMLALAIALTSFAVPTSTQTVKAATKTVNPKDYKNYVDYLEAWVLSLSGSKKVKPSDKTDIVSDWDESGNIIYQTYSDIAKQRNFMIPSDCTQVLVDNGYNSYVGYKKDGSKVLIVNNYGYDMHGYDKDGKNANGDSWKNISTNDTDETSEEDFKPTKVKSIDVVTYTVEKTPKSLKNFTSKKYITSYSKPLKNNIIGLDDVNWDRLCGWDKEFKKYPHGKPISKVFDARNVKVTNGKETKTIDESHYKVSVKKEHADEAGHGFYKMTVKTDKCCGNLTYSETIKIVPGASYIWHGFFSNPRLTHLYYSYETDLKIEYVVSKDVNFKKITNVEKIESKVTNPAFVIPVKKDGAVFYIKARACAKVNGKKLYSDWAYFKCTYCAIDGPQYEPYGRKTHEMYASV